MLLPCGSYYRGWALELLWQQQLSRDRPTISEIYSVYPRVCMCVWHDHVWSSKRARAQYAFEWDTHRQCVFVYRPSADIWSDGDLPPGWREISDSSEVYFWHVPTGTTQYHRPVASGNQQTPPNTDKDAELEPQQETQDSLKPPNEVRAPTNIFIFNSTCTKWAFTSVGFSIFFS